MRFARVELPPLEAGVRKPTRTPIACVHGVDRRFSPKAVAVYRTKELLVVRGRCSPIHRALNKKPLSCGSCRLVAQFDSNSKGTAGPGRASCRSRLQKMSGGVECRRPSSSVATECISTRILPWNQHLGGILVRAGPCTCSDRQIEPGMPSRRC